MVAAPIPDDLSARFAAALPAGLDYATLRVVSERTTTTRLERGVVQPYQAATDRGAMVTVHKGGGLGYAATADLSVSGLRAAFARAVAWAEQTAGQVAFAVDSAPRPHPTGVFRSPVAEPLAGKSVGDQVAHLQALQAGLPASEHLVYTDLSFTTLEVESRLLTSGGGHVTQHTTIVSPDATIVAHKAGVTQRRSLGLRGHSRQGGWEVLAQTGFDTTPATLAEQALQLLDAPDCPAGTRTLVLAPDQMMLQIHESIGHPLELDRILGDERNYAGTSFVTPEMFGTYRYGSDLLNVTFDPGVPGELASYGWDDEGAPATRQHLIENGILVRGLGSSLSQQRSGVAGVANSRATSWNRPPIDRMANLNVEPGTQTVDELVSEVEDGVWMETNTSWSIDDSRNKFQFGCELGWVIKDGQKTQLVRNPNYRGVSATFWRSLSGVSNRASWEVLGTPYCGKGEPNQVIRVGHASPAARFDNIDIFGGA